MRLYTSIGPNSQVVRMFAAEKGISFDLSEIDIMAGDNRRPPYLAINPLGGTPALMLDDGQIVTETIAVCEYLDEIAPAPPLIGTTPADRATTRMWMRRIDLGFAEPLSLAFRAAEGREMFAPRMIVADEAAAGDLRAMALATLDFIDRQCAPGEFVTGDRFTLADIILFCFVEFATAVGMTLLDGRAWLTAWHGRLASRTSAAA